MPGVPEVDAPLILNPDDSIFLLEESILMFSHFSI
jgi:hypothetical protein